MAGPSTTDHVSSNVRTAERSDAYVPGVHVRVLGPVEVVVEGRQVPLGGPKQRTVLALLASTRGRWVSADWLIDGVWGEAPTKAAKGTLHTYISSLRSQVGSALEGGGAGYRLAIEPEDIDAGLFESSVESARSLLDLRPMDAAQRLRDSLALWRGLPYANASPSLRLEDDARRLNELRVGAIEEAVDAELRLGYDAELVAELEVLASEHPFRERFREQHMLALYRAGRQAEALRAYEKTRRFLAEELGVDPSPRLQELEQRILDQDPGLLVEAHPRVETRTFLLVDFDVEPGGRGRDLEPLMDEAVSVIAKTDGNVSRRTRHGLEAVFAGVAEAVGAVEGVHRRLMEIGSGDMASVVRSALDVGEVEVRDGEFFGPPLNRAARLVAAAHGGQILLSADAHATLSSQAAGWRAKALGEHDFKGMGRPQAVFQLILDGHPETFPPLRVDRPPSRVAAGFARMVRGYEIRDAVATGPTGIVYHGYQASVGREVAIKVTRAELANDAGFIARFEAAARLVARLDHPHIIRVHDYWRDPSGAYVVTQWMAGGALSDALQREPIDTDARLRLVRQLGEALAFAHSRGVAHGGVEEGAVLLDEQGNAYLSGFRVAADGDGASGGPEPTWLRRDVDDFARLVSRLLGLASHRASEDAPADRRVSIEEVVADAERHIGGVVSERPPVPVPNPYKGLLSFDESDQLDFHGRDAVTSELIAKLAESRLVAVVGPSGIGKSSVVRAGLIPALRNGALPGSDAWLITDFTPGAYPFDALSGALSRVAVNWPDAVSERLSSGEGMLAVIERMLPEATQLLVVIDQFEELFTHVSDEKARRSFLEGLQDLATSPKSPVRVVVTLRADYLDAPLRYPGIGGLIRDGIVAVSAPSREELAAAIGLPAQRVGVSCEEGLVERIIDDVDLQPGGLPLLQYALTEMFAARRSNTLTLADYLSSGGVVGALGLRAEAVYSSLSEAARSAAADVFVRLIAVEEAGRDARRRVALTELRNLGIDAALVDEILDRFGEHRLLTFDRDPTTRGPTVEIAHEALSRRWGRYRDWIDERREDLILRERLAWAVREWRERGEDPRFLLEGGRLDHLAGWADGTDLRLTHSERSYLAASRNAQDAQDVRRRRMRTAVAGVLGVAASIMAVLGFAVLDGRQEAHFAAEMARSREYAGMASELIESDSDLALHLALRAIEVAPDPAAPPTEAITALHSAVRSPRTVTRLGVVDAAVSPDGELVAVTGPPGSLEMWGADTGDAIWALESAGGWWGPPQFSPDGSQVAIAFSRHWTEDNRVDEGRATGIYLLDPRTGEVISVLEPAECDWIALPRREAFTPDGSHLIRMVQFEDGEGGCPDSEATDGPVGLRLELVALDSGEVAASFAVEEFRVEDEDHFVRATVDQDFRRILISDAGPPEVPALSRMFNLGDGTELWRRAGVFGVMDPSGRLVAMAGLDPSDAGIDIVNADDGEVIRRLPGHEDTTVDYVFSDDGRYVYSAGLDGTVRVWDAETGEDLFALGQDARGIHRVSLSTDRSRVAAVGGGGAMSIWNLPDRPQGEGVVVDVAPYQVAYKALDAAGGRLAVGAFFGSGAARMPTVLLFDADTGDLIRSVHDHGSQVLALSPDGRILAHQVLGPPFVQRGGALVLRDTASGATTVLPGICSGSDCRVAPNVPYPEIALGVDFSHDGTLLAVGGFSGAWSIWDVTTGEIMGTWTLDQPGGVVLSVSIHPSGRLIAVFSEAGASDMVEVRDIDGESIATIDLLSSSGDVGHLSFSPDGSLLAVGGARLTLLRTIGDWDAIWDANAHDGGVYHLDFSPDGSKVATTGNDGFVRVWDASSGALIHAIDLGDDWAKGLAFVDDDHLVVGTFGGLIETFTLDLEELATIARQRMMGDVTEQDCRLYLHLPACP